MGQWFPAVLTGDLTAEAGWCSILWETLMCVTDGELQFSVPV